MSRLVLKIPVKVVKLEGSIGEMAPRASTDLLVEPSGIVQGNSSRIRSAYEVVRVTIGVSGSSEMPLTKIVLIDPAGSKISRYSSYVTALMTTILSDGITY